MSGFPIRPVTWVESERLEQLAGAKVLLASETFQATGSFKLRAAHHLVAHVKEPMLLAASSGNFGQALAYAAALFKKRCLVVMPDTSARVKVEAVRSFGGEVDLIDVRKVSRSGRIKELSRQQPGAYVASAYDDELVIEGNASLGEELAQRRDEFDQVIVPVGGGGLSAGIVRGLRRSGCGAEVLGAEPLLANDAARSLRLGRLVGNEQEPATVADGARTVSLGVRNWEILREGLGGMIEVEERWIVDGLRELFLLANLKVEPTGALAVGALLQERTRFKGKRMCCVISGGNVDAGLYAALLQQDGAGEIS